MTQFSPVQRVIGRLRLQNDLLQQACDRVCELEIELAAAKREIEFSHAQVRLLEAKLDKARSVQLRRVT